MDSFPQYAPDASRRDEAMGRDGSVSPAWAEIFESCRHHGEGVLEAWRRDAARTSRERGLAYRSDSLDGTEEGWTLDPIPWVISAEEWSRLEAGLSQRLLLYSAILADLYGERRILDKGLVPMEIVLGHRGFLRTLHDLPPDEHTVGLGMTAFDLAKDGGGRPFVLNDRFDSPYGLGLALENRTVVNKVLPDLFRRCQVRRVGYFFSSWFEYLAGRSPSDSPNPRVAILDSSPDGGSSEIGFLANYCGIPRVTASDLTVRDARVWLKALSGLEPVDVIWKTNAGRDLDPLESSHGMTAGVSGLFEAMRENNVAVASHPGAEVLQSPGFYPFLANLCRELLGEDLVLPPVATWWCGDPAARRFVIDNLSSMVVKTVGHHSDFRTRYGRRMPREDLAQLKARIEGDPGRYVGQEELTISTIPTSTDHGLAPRGAVMRTFSFLDAGGIPRVMPGGLGRVGTADGVIISTRQSGESKDIWVRSPVADEPISIARQVEQGRIISPEVVPSRTGENLFWSGRYAERTDSIVRFATRIIEGRSSGFSYDHELDAEHERALVKGLFRIFELGALLKKAKTPDERLDRVLRDETCPVGIAANLRSFHRACLAAREEWSPTSILAIESACDGWLEESEGVAPELRIESRLEALQLNLAAFLGLNLDSMTRDEGWALLDAGRRIERLTMLSGLLRLLLRSNATGTIGTLLNESVLFVSDSLRTYQSKFLTIPATPQTILLLLGEEDYPRSMRFLLERLESVLGKLPAPAKGTHPAELVGPMSTELIGFLSENFEGEQGRPGMESNAQAYLDSLLGRLRELGDLLTKSYFSHVGNPT
ncbi:MAG: circularly permuted type 2 ATP-grasp protein [Verrucomicrobiales bacterium]